jgi:uncharacterized membrane protein YedE/YeeE
METVFTPISSFGGGLAIGLGAVLLMLSLGRILGATGILSGTVFAEDREGLKWRAAMILGMIAAPILIFLFTGKMPEVNVPISPLMIVVGGVIVGFGASLGSGCTSGHGVCGLSRLSVRSMVAVPTFMATGVITLYIIRHVVGA